MDMETRVIGQASAEVVEIAALLVDVAIGETIQYRDITRKVGVDVRIRRHLLDSARRIVMRENSMVFAAEINVGLRRLSDVETVTIIPESRRKKIRNQSKSGLREIGTVNYAELPAEKQVMHNVGMAMFGTLHQLTDRSAVKRLERAVVANDKLPDVEDTLKLIGWISD